MRIVLTHQKHSNMKNLRSLFLILFFTVIGFFSAHGQNDLVWEKLNTEPYPGKQDDIFFINETFQSQS